MKNDVIIIGAGLSGLTTAYFLKQQGKNVLVLEADARIGGRIMSIPSQNGKGSFELGATWFAEKHTHLNELLKMLDVERFEQYEEKGPLAIAGIRELMNIFNIHDTRRIKNSFERMLTATSLALMAKIIYNMGAGFPYQTVYGHEVRYHSKEFQQ